MSLILNNILAWPWYLQLLIVFFLLAFLILVYRLLSEGREVSLGPLKFGARIGKGTNNTVASKSASDRLSGMSPSVQSSKTFAPYQSMVPATRVDARPIALLYIDSGDLFIITESHRNLAVGQSRECDIPINHVSLSRVHLRILIALEPAAKEKLRTYKLSVSDTGSANGTFVNGRRIEQLDLEDGDIIQAGGIRITFCKLMMN